MNISHSYAQVMQEIEQQQQKTYQYLPQSLGLHLSTMLKIRINLCDDNLFRIL